MGATTLAAGCASGDAPATEAVERDSAGISIIENPRAIVEQPAGWTVGGAPNLEIGVVEGEPSHQLFAVTGVGQLTDGRVVVLNAGTQEVRFYDAAGAFLRSVGGEGEGPGEYRFPDLAGITLNDSIVVYDLMAARFTILDDRGRYARSVMAPGLVAEAVGRFTSGRFVVSSGSASAGPDTPEGIIANEVRFLTLGADAAVRDTIAVAHGPLLFLAHVARRISFTRVPFTARPSGAVQGDFLHVTWGAAPEIRTFSADGRLIRIIRVQGPGEPVEDDDFARVVERRVAEGDDPEEREELRRRYGEMRAPAIEPLFEGILVDRLGNVWARIFHEDGGPLVWTVFDRSGRGVG
ncbi:MAG: 6-bladed beta-propeller, partial [Gemmatimonadota bacterium]